jgi:3-methyladenine DNA glycosylase AlkC
MSTKKRLNYAGKTQPEFGKKLCEKWKNESPTKETIYIIKKALRAIEKLKN